MACRKTYLATLEWTNAQRECAEYSARHPTPNAQVCDSRCASTWALDVRCWVFEVHP